MFFFIQNEGAKLNNNKNGIFLFTMGDWDVQQKKPQNLTTMHASKNTMHNGSPPYNGSPIYIIPIDMFSLLSQIHKC